MMKTRFAQILFHVIGSLIYLSLPLIFMPSQDSLSDTFLNPMGQREFLHSVLILSFFYLNYYLLIPRFYFRKKYFYFVLAVFTCFLVVVVLPNLIISTQVPGPGPKPPMPGPGGSRIIFAVGHNIVFFLAVVFFSLMLKIHNRWKHSEKEKLDAELRYFKAQINPHFLFNTLNSIYSLAIQKSDETPEAVVKLSGMMRYVISDASDEFVPLEKELNYISDYIELQKIRYGDTVKVKFSKPGLIPGVQIAPMLLIPFIENAFKFGINPEMESRIDITTELNGPQLLMSIYNMKFPNQDNIEAGEGMGIENARHRLELIYPSKYRLDITETGKDFTVNLKIELS